MIATRFLNTRLCLQRCVCVESLRSGEVDELARTRPGPSIAMSRSDCRSSASTTMTAKASWCVKTSASTAARAQQCSVCTNIRQRRRTQRRTTSSVRTSSSTRSSRLKKPTRWLTAYDAGRCDSIQPTAGLAAQRTKLSNQRERAQGSARDHLEREPLGPVVRRFAIYRVPLFVQA